MRTYNKLLGKMRESGVTQQQLASKIGTTTSTLCRKLNGFTDFRQEEMIKICETLKISSNNIGDYFYEQ